MSKYAFIKPKEIAYICDKKACGDVCPMPDKCNHTKDINHSLHYTSPGEIDLKNDFICINKREKRYMEVEK